MCWRLGKCLATRPFAHSIVRLLSGCTFAQRWEVANSFSSCQNHFSIRHVSASVTHFDSAALSELYFSLKMEVNIVASLYYFNVSFRFSESFPTCWRSLCCKKLLVDSLFQFEVSKSAQLYPLSITTLTLPYLCSSHRVLLQMIGVCCCLSFVRIRFNSQVK